MKEKITITVNKDEIGERIDSFLAKRFPDFSRSYFGNLLKKDLILVNKEKQKASHRIKENDQIEINFQDNAPPDLIPEAVNLDIIYEDNNVLVINKQPGIIVHPGAGNPQGTIANALLAYVPKIGEAVFEKGNPLSESRPGLVHRLDKDTSGVMIIAKNSDTMYYLSKQIKDRTVKKSYLALCYGWPKNDDGRVVNFLGRHPVNRKMITDIGDDKGKIAISNYHVDKYFTKGKNKISLVKFDIQTGRTHQIRTQAKILGFPVLGDSTYNTKESIQLSKELNAQRQLLHAYKLTITLPGNAKPNDFIAPTPKDFEIIINKLNLEY